MKLLFLDESGDHSLDYIDRDYPVFVLGGVIIDRAYHRGVVEPRIQAIKRAFFDKSVILHTADIVRGKNGFEVLNNTDTRLAFYRELNALMRELEYTVIACAIKKHAFVEQRGHQASDPYTIALDVLVEQFTQNSATTTTIIEVALIARQIPSYSSPVALWKRCESHLTRFGRDRCTPHPRLHGCCRTAPDKGSSRGFLAALL